MLENENDAFDSDAPGTSTAQDEATKTDAESLHSSQKVDLNATLSVNEGQTCTICYNDYTTHGEHRLACLPCGHLFGRECVVRWLRTDRNSRICPTCKSKAAIKDVRALYCKGIKLIDNSAVEEMRKMMEEEKGRADKAEHSVAEMRAEIHALKERNELLEAISLSLSNGQMCIDDESINSPKIRKRRRRIQLLDESSDDEEEEFGVHPPIKLTPLTRQPLGINLSDAQSVRCAAYSPNRRTLLVGCRLGSDNALFQRQHGYKMLKPTGTTGHYSSTLVSCHQARVRDIQLPPDDSGIVLTVAEDGYMRVTNMQTCNVLHKYRTPAAQLWCCTFDARPACSHYIYCGAQNGHIYMYDTRRAPMTTAQMQSQYDEPCVRVTNAQSAANGPIVQLHHLNEQGTNGDIMGLLAAKLNQALFFEQHAVDNYDETNENSTRLYRMHKLAISGRLSSLAYCSSEQRMLATMRPNDVRATVRHEVHSLLALPSEEQKLYTSRQQLAFECGPVQAHMTRNTLFASPIVTDRRLLTAVFDEHSSSIQINDAATGTRICQQHVHAPDGATQVLHMGNSNQLALIACGKAFIYGMSTQSD